MRSAEEFGPYVVYEQIGLGGMATVHRAETQGIAGFSKQVALKRMLPSVASDANLVKSFIREARLASHLRHANVAQTYDLGKVGETYFIAMELVPGRNLREILKHSARSRVHMPLAIAMNIVNQIADALDYAHNLCDETGQPLGIIHRDVSPANVIVSEGGTAKLIDFGIAKASGGGMQTMSGAVKGKFSYMAPECLMGFVDARSDLFALGVIAHELLSNRPLFQGKDDMDTLYRVKDMPILPPSRINPQVPSEIEAIIMTALDRDPERRWQRATAMRQALTTETQRLGLVAHNAQVEEWIDRAFAHASDEPSEPSIEISNHTVELAQGTVPDEFLHQADSIETMVRPTGSKPMQAQASEWKVSTDASTIDGQPALGETTLTDAPPVGVFEVPTVAAPVNQKIVDDWNTPSVVETRDDRPRLNEWAASNADETREVQHSAIAEHIERSRTAGPSASSPHVISRAVRNSSTPSPARDSSPTLPEAGGEITRPSAQKLVESPARASSPRQPSSPPSYQDQTRRPSSPPPHQDPTRRPSSPPPNQEARRPSSPLAQEQPRRPSTPPQDQARRPSSPSPGFPVSGARTAPQAVQQLPPIGVPLSGARTTPHLPKHQVDPDAATTEVNVSKSAVLHEAEVGSVLDDLEQRSSVIPPPSDNRAGNYLLALLVLIAAGGAAAVVYFALPYLT